MQRLTQGLSLVAVVFGLGCLYFIPIPTQIMYGESPLCWYHFGVYQYEYDAETGGNTPFSDSLFIGAKVGGWPQYFGLKPLKSPKY